MVRHVTQDEVEDVLDEKTLRQDIVDLICHTRVRNGEIVIYLHEGDMAKVDIESRIRVVFGTTGEAERKTEVIQLDGIEPLVESRFEDVIRNKVGRFGGMRIQVLNGSLREWGFFDRHR